MSLRAAGIPHEQRDERHREQEQTSGHHPADGLPAQGRGDQGEQGQKHEPPVELAAPSSPMASPRCV